MWENDFTQAKIRVQCAAKIDYGQPFCKACFNLEGDADGLSFVTGMEIQKLTSAITDTNLNIDRVIKACTQAEEIVRSAFGRKNAIIEEKKDNLNITLNKLADKISDIEQLRVRTIEEGRQLSIDDKVTLRRRNNHSQVRGTVTHVHTTENGEVTYNIKPDQGADFLNYSEFLLVKSSTKRRALQKKDDLQNLETLDDKKIIQTQRIVDLGNANREKDDIRKKVENMEKDIAEAETEKTQLGPKNKNDWIKYAKTVCETSIRLC